MLKYFFFFFFLMYSFFSQSQNIEEGYWGIKAGVNMNKISNLRYTSSLKPGFHAGLFANFQFNDKLSLMHEVLYSQRGVDLVLTDGSIYRQSYSYIDFPISLNYFLNTNFYLTAGIQPSLYTYFKPPHSDTISYNKDNLNTLDLSYFAGASFISSNNIGFGIRFCASIFPVYKTDELNKNYTLQAFLFYAINKKRNKMKL